MQLYPIFSFSAIALISGTFAFPRDLRSVLYQPNQPSQNIEAIKVDLRDKNARILSYSNLFNPEDNSFVFQYETDNGIKTEGFAKGNKVSVRGSYFIVLPDGNQVPVQYTADENGFQVDSPAIPTPDPSIAKLIAYFRTLPPETEEKEKEGKSGEIEE